MENKKLTRCFIAIDFPDEVIKEIARIQELVENRKFTGKMTELENLHLTLKFIGEIDDEKLMKVRAVLKKIKFDEMELKLGEVGTFSFRDKPRIVWVKVEGKQIWNLQKAIDSALKNLFEPEERFMSHLTLARVKYVKDKKGFVDYIKGIKTKEIKFKVNKFKLIGSELRRLGPVYTILEEYKSD